MVVSVHQHAQWRSPSNLSMIHSHSHTSFDSVVCMFLVTLDKVFFSLSVVQFEISLLIHPEMVIWPFPHPCSVEAVHLPPHPIRIIGL